REDGVVHGVFSARENRSNAGANRAFADPQLPFTGDESGVANEDSVDIGDGIEFSRRAVKRNAEIASARFFRGLLLGDRKQWKKDNREEQTGKYRNSYRTLY